MTKRSPALVGTPFFYKNTIKLFLFLIKCGKIYIIIILKEKILCQTLEKI